MKYYSLGDYIKGIPHDKQQEFMAKFTVGAGASGMGIEFRCPKKGEWYLSGAIPVAYQAPNDLTTEYHIMKIVKIRRIETIEEIGPVTDFVKI
jgi:hypothetical protein